MTENLLEQLLSPEQLSNALGHLLTLEEWKRCLQHTKFLNPKVGKFWEEADLGLGIYIITAGKARLLDEAGELIATLSVGASFGEFSLFNEAEFKPYAVRILLAIQG